MGQDGLCDAARHELRDSLLRLPPAVRFQVIVYNRVPRPLRIGARSGLVPATPENKAEALRLLDGLRPEGGTQHAAALRQALDLQPDAIFFLTDAADLRPEEV